MEMVDLTTLPPNKRLINTEAEYGPYVGQALLERQYYKTSHDISKLPYYEAIVYAIDNCTTQEYAVDDQTIASGPTNSRYKVYAYVEGITLTPKPSDYMINFSCDGQGGVKNNPALEAQIKQLPRFYVEANQSPPSLRERIHVNWRVKVGDFDYWREPYYVGPVRQDVPLKEPLPNESPDAAAAYSEAANGQVQTSSPIDDLYLYNNAPPGHPEKPIKSLLEASGLVHMLREIYIDKKLDYSKVKKYDIIPAARATEIRELTQQEMANSKYVQHRKQNKAFFLPDDVTIKQRKATKLFIIRETGKNYIQTHKDIYSSPTMHYNIAMNSVYDGSHKNLETKSIANKDRLCTIRVNVPYGIMINEKDDFSANSVGCMISSPFDGKSFFGFGATWDKTKTIKEINDSDKFKTFKAKLNTWISQKKLPDGSDPIIMGPYGTPGLRTGPWAKQEWPSSILDLSNNHFWTGQLSWSSTGHYFLPTLEQVDALYELLTSILESPPRSNFSWAFQKPIKHKSLLTWNFPVFDAGSLLLTTNHFIDTQKYYTEYNPGFPWGPIGPLQYKKKNKPIHLWEAGLNKNGPQAVYGIVSYSRWGSDSSPFIEHYILGRQLGLGHMESWYVTLAVAAETYPKIQNGKGLGPTLIPAFGDIALNKYLEKGQKMWFRVLEYLRKPEEISEPPEIVPKAEKDVLPEEVVYKIGPPCEY
jgi:hypothetical protein